MTALDNTKVTDNKPGLKKILFATCIGNVLEWFDIAVYSYFAVYISHAFFPTKDPAVSLLLTFGSFGVSFLIRPLGAIVLGNYADKHGRKSSLMLSILLMMLGSLAIFCMPTYESIGIAAPLLIMAARLVQGFSAGGEFGSSTAFLVEHYPERKAYIASWQFATQGMATLLASLFGLVLSLLLSAEALSEWGWRIPFLVGALIGPVGLYIRRNVPESPQLASVDTSGATPFTRLLAKSKLALLIAIGVLAISTAVNYMIHFVPTYATKNLHLSDSVGFSATLLAGVILSVFTPVMGLLAERVGRPRVVWTALVFLMLSIMPVFWMISAFPSAVVLILMIGWLAFLKSAYFATIPSIMADLFPTEMRASGMAIGYNVSVTVFGGFSPMICSYLVNVSGSNSAPGYYLMLLGIISALALVGFSQKRI